MRHRWAGGEDKAHRGPPTEDVAMRLREEAAEVDDGGQRGSQCTQRLERGLQRAGRRSLARLLDIAAQDVRQGPPEMLGSGEHGVLEGTRLGSQSDPRHRSQPVPVLEFFKAWLVDVGLVQQSPIGGAEAFCRLAPVSERDGAGVVSMINFVLDQRFDVGSKVKLWAASGSESGGAKGADAFGCEGHWARCRLRRFPQIGAGEEWQSTT